jgi:hypothetical protein
MDAIDLLRQQHEEAQDLFLRVDGARGEQRREYFLRLARLLTVHAHLEEEQLYVALRRPDTVDFLIASEEEHADVKRHLAQMAKMDPDSWQFRTYLVELRAAIDAHIAEEQAILFPKASRILGVEGLAALGESMTERLDELAAPGGIQTFSQESDFVAHG